MTTAHDELSAIARAGAQRFAATDLAASHAGVIRSVRRHRVARGSVTALAGVGIVGAGAFGALQLRGADALAPAASVPPTAAGAPAATLAPEDPDPTGGVLEVAPGEHADAVLERLAEMYGVDVETARTHVVSFLPDEARGEPEGWLAAGRHGTWAEDGEATTGTLTQQASALSRSTEAQLDSNAIRRADWRDTVIIASIAQAEASDAEDMRGVARVIENRLAAGMNLELDSTLRYAAKLEGADLDSTWTTAEQRAQDGPYNTYVNAGLPPTAIGAPSGDAIDAAANPADEDWLFFIREPSTDRVLFASTFEQHLENVEVVQEQLSQQ